MKRNYILILITILSVGGFLTSCYDDYSTLDINEIPGVSIDTTGVEKLNVYQFEHLIVNPTINTLGISDADLSYKWQINIAPNDTTYELIGEEKNLDYEVFLKPNEGSYHYQLVFTVTDNLNELDYIMAWPTYVKNSLGEGLVIASSSDGINSDLSLIMAPEVTVDFPDVKVVKGIYSINNNGGLIDGIVKQLRSASVYGVDVMFGITDNSFFRVNKFDYTLAGTNNDLFYAHSETFNPQIMGYINQGDIYVGSGILTGTYLGASRKFGLPIDASFILPDHVAMNKIPNVPIAINFYDEVNEAFVYLPTISAYGDHDMHITPSSTSAQAFDPTAITNKINIAAATNDVNDFLHLLKDKTTDKIELYVFDGGESVWPDIYPPHAKALFDLSDAPDIDNATQFVFMDNQKVMFYATSTKIYAMLYATTIPTFEERYTAPAGEEITTLQVYHQVGDPYSMTYLPTDNKQLIMSTYSTEGKVYLLPIINIGAANIDVANIKSFSGFDRISAITAQN